MKYFRARIVGVTPLLVNRLCEEDLEGDRGVRQGERLSAHEDAEKRLHFRAGIPVIPQPNILACMTEAGRYFKAAGNQKVSTIKSSLIPAAVMIEELEMPIITEKGWSVDTRPVRIPATGGRVIRHRPCFYDWGLEFTLEIDPEILSVGMVRDVLDAAGKRIGLCDFRPACKGPFGKFRVDLWEELKDRYGAPR